MGSRRSVEADVCTLHDEKKGKICNFIFLVWKKALFPEFPLSSGLLFAQIFQIWPVIFFMLH